MTPAARYQSVAELKNAVSQSYYPAQHKALLLPVIQVNMHTITMIIQTIQPMPILLNELSTTVLPVSSHPISHENSMENAAILSRISVHNMACLSLELENTYGAKLWLERIFCLGMFIFAIFCGFNYLNVQNIRHFARAKPLPALCRHNTARCGSDFCSICDYVHYRVCCIPYKVIFYIIAHKNKPCSHRCGGNIAYILFFQLILLISFLLFICPLIIKKSH